MPLIPNILTLLRILMIFPILALLLFWDTSTTRFIALGLFTIASLTDFLDGYLARRFNSQSDIGRFLDPIADKLLVTSLLLTLCGIGNIQGVHILAAVLILMREITISGLREFLSGAKVPLIIHVSKIAKWKTSVQLLTLGVFIIVRNNIVLFGIPILDSTQLQIIGDILLWASALLTLMTGFTYLKVGIKSILKESENSLHERENTSHLH